MSPAELDRYLSVMRAGGARRLTFGDTTIELDPTLVALSVPRETQAEETPPETAAEREAREKQEADDLLFRSARS